MGENRAAASKAQPLLGCGKKDVKQSYGAGLDFASEGIVASSFSVFLSFVMLISVDGDSSSLMLVNQCKLLAYGFLAQYMSPLEKHFLFSNMEGTLNSEILPVQVGQRHTKKKLS